VEVEEEVNEKDQEADAETKATPKIAKAPAKPRKTKSVSIKTETAMPAAPATPARIPAHQWTNGAAEVLVLKCVAKGGKAYGDFVWPLTVGAPVEAESWNPKANAAAGCTLALGMAMGDGKEPDWNAAWLVFGSPPSNVIDLGGKCKAKSGIVRFVGTGTLRSCSFWMGRRNG